MPLCRRIAWALILALVCCALPCWAAAEPEESAPALDTVYINVTNAQIYHKPSTRAKKYVRLSYGDSLYLKNYNSSWAELTEGTDAVGYCKTGLLSYQNPASAEPETRYAKSEGVKVYKRAYTSSSVLGKLKESDPVLVVAVTPDKKWARIQWSEGFAFVQVASLTTTPPQEPVTVYVKAASAPAYKSASASRKVGTVYYGETLTLTKISGSWARISNSVGSGWVKKSALSLENPNFDPVSYYCTAASGKIRVSLSTSAKTLGTLKRGETIQAVAITPDRNWLRVIWGEGYGYMRANELALEMPAEEKVYINQNIVAAYKSASSSSKKVGEVCYGDELTLIQKSNTWSLISNAAGSGWVKTQYLTPQNPCGLATVCYVKSNSAAAYKKPSTSSGKVETLDKNEAVTAVAETPSGGWVRVLLDGQSAFMQKSALTTTPPPDYPIYVDPYKGTASETLEAVIALAIAQYGKPYVYAAAGPDSYDCTGLTCYAFKKKAGITLKRSAYAQGYDDTYPKIESISDLKRGDLVFFDTVNDGDDLSDHVGIYLGGGLFVHSSSGAGKVIVSSLTSGYYNRVFSWGRRIIK